MEENTVRIVEWPKEQAAILDHQFKQPVPVQVGGLKGGQPVDVNMNMHINDMKQVPLCIRICEPICAKSRYSIGINLLGQSFAEITITGVTQIANCDPSKATENDIRFANNG
ncbi:MAG TPA: hypothetical protein VIU12_08990 [Chryseolinea sp.]